MKIISLHAANVLRLTAVDITPDGNTVIISGKNAQGKSSVLNSIWLALDYASAHKSLSEPLHKGEAEGEVTLDLGDFTVTREFSGDKTKLKVENRAGARYPSPQAMLDKLIGSLSFDPVAFATMRDEDQLKVLRDLVGLDFTDLDRQRKEVYEERTLVNRQLKEAEALLADLPKPDAKAPVDLMEISDLQQKISEAHSKQMQRSELGMELDGTDVRIESRREQIEAKRAEIARLERDIEGLEEDLADLAVKRADLVRQFDSIKLPNVGSLTEQLADLEKNREAMAKRESYHKQKARVEALSTEAYELSKQLKAIDDQKDAQLSSCNMPIAGLSFDDSQVLYNGVPFRQASQAEQLRVSMAMAFAMSPDIRVVRVQDGSLLDDDNFAVIQQMAEEHDMQVWIERVESSPGTMGIYIENGEVAYVDGKPTKEK